jgi:hypothetical protein
MGVNVMLGGLYFQVLTLVVFSILGLEFAWRVSLFLCPSTMTQKNYARAAGGLVLRAVSTSSFSSPSTSRIIMLTSEIALATSVVLVIIRSIYRVIEMPGGYDGKLMKNQATFLVFEGAFAVLPVLLLLVFHPGSSFAEIRTESIKSIEGTSLMDLQTETGK